MIDSGLVHGEGRDEQQCEGTVALLNVTEIAMSSRI